MTGWFFLMIWVGGACAMDGRKIGFWARVFWPAAVGERLHEWARAETQGDE